MLGNLVNRSQFGSQSTGQRLSFFFGCGDGGQAGGIFVFAKIGAFKIDPADVVDAGFDQSAIDLFEIVEVGDRDAELATHLIADRLEFGERIFFVCGRSIARWCVGNER